MQGKEYFGWIEADMHKMLPSYNALKSECRDAEDSIKPAVEGSASDV